MVLSCSCLEGIDLFFKEDRIDFGGAALTLLSSHFSLLLH
jgi:hypothetical protein